MHDGGMQGGGPHIGGGHAGGAHPLLGRQISETTQSTSLKGRATAPATSLTVPVRIIFRGFSSHARGGGQGGGQPAGPHMGGAHGAGPHIGGMQGDGPHMGGGHTGRHGPPART